MEASRGVAETSLGQRTPDALRSGLIPSWSKDEKIAYKTINASLTEHLDTKGPGGTALMQMLGVFAEFERNIIAERTKLGVRQAMADGKIVGRPSKLDKEKRKHLLEMINAGQKTQAEMARVFKINRSVISPLTSKQRIKDQQAVKVMAL